MGTMGARGDQSPPCQSLPPPLTSSSKKCFMMALMYSPTRFGSALSARVTSATPASSTKAADSALGEISGSVTGAAWLRMAMDDGATPVPASELPADAVTATGAAAELGRHDAVDGRRTAACQVKWDTPRTHTNKDSHYATATVQDVQIIFRTETLDASNDSVRRAAADARGSPKFPLACSARESMRARRCDPGARTHACPPHPPRGAQAHTLPMAHLSDGACDARGDVGQVAEGGAAPSGARDGSRTAEGARHGPGVLVKLPSNDTQIHTHMPLLVVSSTAAGSR